MRLGDPSARYNLLWTEGHHPFPPAQSQWEWGEGHLVVPGSGAARVSGTLLSMKREDGRSRDPEAPRREGPPMAWLSSRPG